MRLRRWSSASRQRSCCCGGGERGRLAPSALFCSRAAGAASRGVAGGDGCDGCVGGSTGTSCAARAAAAASDTAAQSFSATRTENFAVNSEPCPGALLTLTSPPAARAHARAMCSPRPEPPPALGSAASYARNTREHSSGVMPRPWSDTVASSVCVGKPAPPPALAVASSSAGGTPGRHRKCTSTPRPSSNLAPLVICRRDKGTRQIMCCLNYSCN